MASWEGTLYAAYGDANGSLLVFDTTDPLNPSQSGLVPGEAGPPLAANSSGIVSGYGYVYAPPSGAGALPTAVGVYDFSPSIYGMFRAGDRVLVATGRGGLRILDATSSPAPQELGSYDLPLGAIDSVLAEGDLAYVFGSDTGFRVLDIEDPSNPLPIGHIAAPLGRDNTTGLYRLSKTGSLICLTEPNGGLALVDVENPSAPIIAGQIPTEMFGYPDYPWNATIRGSSLITIAQGKVATFDISDPAIPALLTSFPVADAGVSANLAGQPCAFLGKIFVPGEHGGILAWDVSDPAQLGYPDRYPEWCYGMCLAGDRLYAFDPHSGIRTYRLIDSPEGGRLELAEPEFALPGVLDGIAYDDRLYVSKGTSIEIYRIPPANPQLSAMAKASTGPASFEFYGRSGARYLLQRSADLQTWQDWQEVSTYSDSIGFIDPSPPGPHAFYRALELRR